MRCIAETRLNRPSEGIGGELGSLAWTLEISQIQKSHFEAQSSRSQTVGPCRWLSGSSSGWNFQCLSEILFSYCDASSSRVGRSETCIVVYFLCKLVLYTKLHSVAAVDDIKNRLPVGLCVLSQNVVSTRTLPTVSKKKSNTIQQLFQKENAGYKITPPVYPRLRRLSLSAKDIFLCPFKKV